MNFTNKLQCPACEVGTFFQNESHLIKENETIKCKNCGMKYQKIELAQIQLDLGINAPPRAIFEAAARLPANRQSSITPAELLRLIYDEGGHQVMSQADVARYLGISRQAVSSRIAKAFRRLRAVIV